MNGCHECVCMFWCADKNDQHRFSRVNDSKVQFVLIDHPIPIDDA